MKKFCMCCQMKIKMHSVVVCGDSMYHVTINDGHQMMSIMIAECHMSHFCLLCGILCNVLFSLCHVFFDTLQCVMMYFLSNFFPLLVDASGVLVCHWNNTIVCP